MMCCCGRRYVLAGMSVYSMCICVHGVEGRGGDGNGREGRGGQMWCRGVLL